MMVAVLIGTALVGIIGTVSHVTRDRHEEVA
jgi:hypothetical protein